MNGGASGGRIRHMPALDGLRAVAIGGVVAYHLGLGVAPGGYLGVDLFFVLSGFLITSLLVEEHTASSRIALGAFWARRARRLLPALLLLLVVLAAVAGAGWLAPGTDLGAVRTDALATLAYVANWHQLVAGQSYFSQFAQPSPLQHTWSLAIEEQFYVVWPLVVAAILWARRRSGRVGAGAVGAAAGTGALASALWMGWLAGHGAAFDRLYYGTDTRAFELLVGAALATVFAGRTTVRTAAPSRQRLALRHGGGLLAAGSLLALWATAGGPPRLVFEGGMAVAALAAAMVVADVRDGHGPLARALSLRPLRYVGRISYGIYLWHWPIVCEVNGARTGLSAVPLDIVRLALMMSLAAASNRFVEGPLRTAALHRPRRVGWAAPAAMLTTALAVLAGTVTVGTQAGAAAVVSGSAPPGAGSVSGEVPLALPSPPSAAAPLKVLLLGDSVMRAQAPAVEAALGATGAASVVDHSYPGWGLSNDTAWATELPALLSAVRPQLVVATWSWDDEWALADPAGYRAALDRSVEVLLHPGPGQAGVAGVVFEQFPPLGTPPPGTPAAAGFARRQAGVRAWNALVSALPARFPGQVAYVPVAGAVEVQGRFTAWLGAPGAPRTGWVRVRSVDGTHFCPAGAARYSAALAADLHQLAGLPLPVGSWWDGPWVHDRAVYDTPPGSCPADHPA